MKKVLAVLLSAALIFALAACGGSDKETTAAPTEAPKTTEAPATTPQTTEAPTQAPTLPQPTSPAPTTPAATEPEPTTPEATEPEPTTPEATEPEETEPVAPPAEADAEEVFNAMAENLMNLVMAYYGQGGEDVQLSFSASGEFLLNLSADLGEEPMEIPIRLSGTAKGIMDTAKGVHLNVEYTETLSSLILMLLGMEAEPVTAEEEMYVDKADSRRYEYPADAETWYYTDLDLEEDPESFSLEGFTLEALFKEYTFSQENGCYVFEGILNMEAVEEADEGGLTSSFAGLSLDDAEIQARLTVDDQMRLAGLTLHADPMAIDMGEGGMEGLAGSLDVLDGELTVVYEPVNYELPEEIREQAVEMPDDIYSSEHPWADNVFVTDNEVLVDNEFFRITAVSVADDDFYGAVVTLLIENKSDHALIFDLDQAAVNGYLVSSFEYETVDAGQSLTMEVGLSEDDMLKLGFTSLDRIDFLFKVTDAATWADVADEAYVFYPTGLDADSVVVPGRPTDANEFVVLDNDDLTVIFLYTENDPFYGYSLTSYVLNKSDKDLRLEFEDVTINGIDLDTWWTSKIPAGYQALSSWSFNLESIEVSAVEEIAATLLVSDADDFWGEAIYETGFSYNP